MTIARIATKVRIARIATIAVIGDIGNKEIRSYWYFEVIVAVRTIRVGKE